jgi:uncharacterized RmlC-like cupin family protein
MIQSAHMTRVEVVSTVAEESGSRVGIDWRQVFETDTAQVGLVRIGAGVGGPWHHHGDRTLYGYVVLGSCAMEFGPGGTESVVVAKGDFYRIPPRLIHRNLNLTRVDAVISIFNIGAGPATVDVSGPDG